MVCVWGLCFLFAIGVALSISSERERAEAAKLQETKRKREEARKTEVEVRERELRFLRKEVYDRSLIIRMQLNNIFLPNVQYSYISQAINEELEAIGNRINDMDYQNDHLKYLFPQNEQEEKINQYREKVYPELKKQIEKFNEFHAKIKEFTLLINKEKYGCINEQGLSSIMKIDRGYAVRTIEKYSALISKENLTQTDLDIIYQINLAEILGLIWYFATEKVYSATDFSRAENLFLKIYKKEHVEIIIAKLYVKKKIGGENALRESIRNLLKVQRDSEKLHVIASGLMWMKAYQAESMVLENMLEKGMQMSPKEQERLQILANGGGKAPDEYRVKSTEGKIYLDVTALSWREDEYKNFFDSLAFRDSNLTYSLAVRDEEKELYVTREILIPKQTELYNKLKVVYKQEYGTEVLCNPVEVVAMSGNDKEILEGILVSPQECRQMGILIYLIKIGKKLDIKFYTLAMPIRVTIEEQPQKTLALYKKLSPSLNVWESSLRETALIGIQQLLNMAQQTTSSEYESAARSEREKDEPVF